MISVQLLSRCNQPSLTYSRLLCLNHKAREISTSSITRQQNDPLKVFQDNATKWWTGKEFSILRAMNEIRVPFIVDGLGKPMKEAKILDVGCGGGILSEPLARLGADVMGIDPVFESINQAQLHSQNEPDLKDRLKYRNCNIEDVSSQPEHVESFDALVASEVLEHIEDIEGFLMHCTKVIKPNGSLFITTINQTPLSWLGVIFFGEYVLQQLPKGTHEYDMFVSVKGLKIMLERMGYHIRLVNGFMYEPVGGNFYWAPTTLTHYAMQAVKVAPISKGLNYEQRRHAPKSKGNKVSKPKIPLDDDDMVKVIPIDVYRSKTNEVIQDFKLHMETKLTTRTSSAAIETLKIEIPGLNEPLEIRDVATITMKGQNLIMLNLAGMPEAIKPTMKALEQLGTTNAQTEVNCIYVPIPRVTREHRERLATTAKQLAQLSKDKLKSCFSEFSSLAKSQQSSGKVSIDLIRNTVENLDYDKRTKLMEIDQILKTKLDQLLNQQT